MRIGLSFRESLVGEALACLLEGRRAWPAAFVAPSVADALERASHSPIGVLLVDTLGIQADEIQALIELQECGEVAVVLLVAESSANAYLDLPLERVLSRRSSSEELFAALDEVSRRGRRRRHKVLPFELSGRELECAQLVSRGLSNRRIAELTGLREQSVKNVVSLAMRKMAVENRVQIALRLTQAGVADTLPTRADTLPTRAVVSISVPEAVEA